MGDLVIGHLGQDFRHASGQLGKIDMAVGIDIHAAIVTDTFQAAPARNVATTCGNDTTGSTNHFVFCQLLVNIGSGM
jgi:hypothetical protein